MAEQQKMQRAVSWRGYTREAHRLLAALCPLLPDLSASARPERDPGVRLVTYLGRSLEHMRELERRVATLERELRAVEKKGRASNGSQGEEKRERS